MKLKVVVVDLELSRETKRTLLTVAVAMGLLAGFGSSVHADTVPPPHTYANGEALTADTLNGDFLEVRTEIATALTTAQNAHQLATTVAHDGEAALAAAIVVEADDRATAKAAYEALDTRMKALEACAAAVHNAGIRPAITNACQ